MMARSAVFSSAFPYDDEEQAALSYFSLFHKQLLAIGLLSVDAYDRFASERTLRAITPAEPTVVHLLETIITDLMSGQFNDPIRVVAFNTLEHWSDGARDVR
jgi:hypothetical protein